MVPTEPHLTQFPHVAQVMREYAAMWAALRYRKGQAAALAVLAALVTTCAVFAPLYDLAMRESLVDVRLAQSTQLNSGLQLEASSRVDNRTVFQVGQSEPPPTPTELLAKFPRSALASYHAPVLGWTDNLDVLPDRGLTGQLMWRTGACDHVRIVSGRCPEAAGEILVSSADVHKLGLRDKQRLTVAEPSVIPTFIGPTRELTVVGAYEEVPGDDRFVQALTGISGTFSDGPPRQQRHDVWLTPEETFTSGAGLPQVQSYVGLQLRPDRVGADEMLRLGSTLTALRTKWLDASTGPRLRLTTGLTDIADDLRSQQRDSRIIVPLLMAQLALLGLVVLWLALRAVTDLRRSEVAVARLRGEGVRGARRLLLGELLPAVLLGVVPGVAAAWVGCLVATRLLPGDAGVEVRAPFWIALAAAVLVLVATTLLAASRVARIPVDALLRRSSTVRRGWRVGALDAVLITGCGVVVAAFLTGSLNGPAALIAPAVVALLVGLLLAHVLTPLAAATGRALLRRGRARLGVGFLEAARGPALRSTVTVVTVAAALAVFAIDAVAVADRNRAAAAAQEAGAPYVALVDSNDLAAVETATAGSHAVTPVVRLKAPAADAVTTLAVRPADFRRIALLPGADLSTGSWTGLTGTDVTPVTVKGNRLSLVATDQGLTSTAPDGSGVTVTLGADLAAGDHVFHTEFGALPRAGTRRMTTTVSCTDGCTLVSLSLSTLVGSSMAGTVGLSDVTADGAAVPLGDGWRPFRDPTGASVVPSTESDGISLEAKTDGQQRVTVPQGWVPLQVPALITDATPRDSFQLTGLDGRTRAAGVVGRLARVPGAPERTAVVDLDVLRRAATVASDARIELWASDRAALDEVTAALHTQGIAIVDTTTLADVRRGYDQSTAAWSVRLGLLVGLAGVAVALLLLAVLAVSSWRVRARDLAALWLSGVPRRSVRSLAWTAQLPAVVLGAVAGAACGLLGAALSMPIVPLFAEAPGVSTLDLATPWLPVLVVAAAALVVLTGWSAFLGWSVFRRASLDRLRETA